MLSTKFNKELKKGLPNPIYFLWSNEGIFLNEALNEVVDIVITPHQKDFNYDVFYPTTDLQEILNAALTMPLLSQRRLVVLKDFYQFSKFQVEALTPYFKNPCNTTCMLILSLKDPKIIDIRHDVYSLKIRESDIPAWLRHTALKKGIRMTESAVEYLIEAIGPNAGLLAMEIEKLALSGQKTIDNRDIASYIGITREYIPFNLIDALVAGKTTKAFKILKTLTEGRPSDAPAVLGALNWHYRQFYKLWENKGRRPLKIKETTFRALLKYIPYYTQDSFSEIFHYLHEADVGIKTFARPEISLEILLIKLLQARAKN